jgi:hypothetical protein
MWCHYMQSDPPPLHQTAYQGDPHGDSYFSDVTPEDVAALLNRHVPALEAEAELRRLQSSHPGAPRAGPSMGAPCLPQATQCCWIHSPPAYCVIIG